MLSCDVIIWDDNTPLFYFSWKLHSLQKKLEYFEESENFSFKYINFNNIQILFVCWLLQNAKIILYNFSKKARTLNTVWQSLTKYLSCTQLYLVDYRKRIKLFTILLKNIWIYIHNLTSHRHNTIIRILFFICCSYKYMYNVHA